MKSTVKKIKSLLDEAEIKYTSKMRKKDLVASLVKNVDSRYYLFAMTVKQLRSELHSRNESRVGRKADLIERIWNKETNNLAHIDPTNHRCHTDTEAPLQTEPISDFLRLKTGEELMLEYNRLTGRNSIPEKLSVVEDLSSAVAYLSHQKVLDDIFKNKLNSDTLSVVMSFLPTDTHDQGMRIKMIEDAEQYGCREDIRQIIQTLMEMQLYNETPEYIDENATEFRRSQLFLKEEETVQSRRRFATIFAKYYNTYVRGDVNRLDDAFDDLERKMTLCLSSIHHGLVENEYVKWKQILNYDDHLTMSQRMNKLNKLRPEIDTTEVTRIDMARLRKMDTSNHRDSEYLDEITQEDLDNASLLGTYNDIKIMIMLEEYCHGIDTKTIPTLDDLLRDGASYIPFKGGNFRKAAVRLDWLFGDVWKNRMPYSYYVSSKRILDICLSMADTGVQSQWKMTRDEWKNGRTQEREYNAERIILEYSKRTGESYDIIKEQVAGDADRTFRVNIRRPKSYGYGCAKIRRS